jgi:hypothetical protein
LVDHFGDESRPLLVGDICLARLDIEQGQGWDQAQLRMFQYPGEVGSPWW